MLRIHTSVLAKTRRLDQYSRWHLHPRGLTRENIEQAAGEEVVIRDKTVVVVAGSETDRPVSLLCWS
jgi:hypothetical protein